MISVFNQSIVKNLINFYTYKSVTLNEYYCIYVYTTVYISVTLNVAESCGFEIVAWFEEGSWGLVA